MVSMSVLMMDIPVTIVSLLCQKLLRTLLQLAGNFTPIMSSTTLNLMTLKLKLSKSNLSSETNNKQMTISNPYVENLVQMGYDRKDVETASTMFQKKTFPYTIHGRTYQTEEEYNEAIHEFMNGM